MPILNYHYTQPQRAPSLLESVPPMDGEWGNVNSYDRQILIRLPRSKNCGV